MKTAIGMGQSGWSSDLIFESLKKGNVSNVECLCDKEGVPDKHSCQYYNYENKCTRSVSNVDNEKE